MAQRNPNSTFFMAVTPLLLVAILLCSFSQTSESIRNDPKKAGGRRGLSLRMKHIDSPDSPMYKPNVSDFDRMQKWVSMSDSRLKYLSKKTTTPTRTRNATTAKPEFDPVVDLIRPPLGNQDFAYIVTVGVGQFDGEQVPWKLQYLNFDTGSDVTWIQCEGCAPWCFHQTIPLYPRTRSRTYQETSPAQEVVVSYLDDSSMKGVWATETFTFNAEDPQTESVTGIHFACGTNMTNFKYEDNNPTNSITGMLGMGGRPVSLISQLGYRGDINYEFSYCLQDFLNNRNNYSPMYLRFGEDVVVSQPYLPKTTICTYDDGHGYFLELLGLSVDGQWLSNIDSSVFGGTGSGVTGTILSLLVQDAYDKLEAAIETYIGLNNEQMRRADPPFGSMTCWEEAYVLSNPNYPSVTFHFKDADMVVEGKHMFYVFTGLQGYTTDRLHCLTVRPSANQVSIIGAFQQMNQRIVINLFYSDVIIKPDDCSMAN